MSAKRRHFGTDLGWPESCIESAREGLWWSVVAGILWSIVSPLLSILGLASDSTCLRVDCFQGSEVRHHGVARLSQPAEALLEREAALRETSQSAPRSAFPKLMVVLGQ